MSDVSRLVPFTGYYSMDAAPGAFLSIDTTEIPSPTAGVMPVPTVPTITVNVSMDGRSCTSYAFDGDARFDGTVLNIPAGHIKLEFSRTYDNGKLTSFSGTVGDKNTKVNGSTYYNPVPLSAFIGDYFDVETGNKVLSIKTESLFLFDFSIFSGGNGILQPVESHSYTPAMFVLTFSSSGPNPAKFVLMLGTAAKSGLACSIQGDGLPRFAVSILPSGS